MPNTMWEMLVGSGSGLGLGLGDFGTGLSFSFLSLPFSADSSVVAADFAVADEEFEVGLLLLSSSILVWVVNERTRWWSEKGSPEASPSPAPP